MLTVACVKWGDKYTSQYVNNLQAMVSRNLSLPHRFLCITEDPSGVNCETRKLEPGAVGWWNKLHMFQSGYWQVGEAVLYLDLDVAVVGPLDKLATFDSDFAMHRDFANPRSGASAVMLLRGNPHPEVWSAYQCGGSRNFRGDQEFIFSKVVPDFFPKRWVVSYKLQAMERVPTGARLVCFHGNPKPHECAGWVTSVWNPNNDLPQHSKLRTFRWSGQVRFGCPECSFDAPTEKDVMQHWKGVHTELSDNTGLAPTLFDVDDKPIDKRIIIPEPLRGL